MKYIKDIIILSLLILSLYFIYTKYNDNNDLNDLEKQNKELLKSKDFLLSENLKLEKKIIDLNDSLIILENKKENVIEIIREIPIYLNSLSLQENDVIAKKVDDVFSISEISNNDSTYIHTRPITFQDRSGFIIDRWVAIDYIILDTMLNSYILLNDVNEETIKNLKYQNSFLRQEITNFNKIVKIDSTVNGNLQYMLEKEKQKKQFYKSIGYGAITTTALTILKVKPKYSFPLGMGIGGISYVFKF